MVVVVLKASAKASIEALMVASAVGRASSLMTGDRPADREEGEHCLPILAWENRNLADKIWRDPDECCWEGGHATLTGTALPGRGGGRFGRECGHDVDVQLFSVSAVQSMNLGRDCDLVGGQGSELVVGARI